MSITGIIKGEGAPSTVTLSDHGSISYSGLTKALQGTDGCDDANPALSLWRVRVMCLDGGPFPTGYSIYGVDPDDSDPGVKDAAEDPGLDVLFLGG